MKKFFFQIILVIAAVILQSSIFAPFYPLNQIKIILLLALIGSLSDRKRAIFLAATGGLFLDIFSTLPFLTITLSLLLTIAVIIILFNNLFTSGSLYALIALGIIAIFVYNFCLVSIIYLLYLLKATEIQVSIQTLFNKNLIWQFVINVPLMLVGFKLRKKYG